MFEGLKVSREIQWFKNKWISIMANTGKFNKMKDTFSLNNVEKTEYGFKALILIVDGLRYAELEEIKDVIEDNYGCMCIFNKSKRTNLINADFIFEGASKEEYRLIIDLKPWEVYLGNTYSKEPIVVDLIKYPHILITGGTRSGKSKMTDCIITNLICNCSIEELELYLIQVAKSDLILYEDVKQCRGFADNLNKAIKLLKHIENKMTERDKYIRPFRKKAEADNYIDYNKIKKNQPMSTVYVIFDETSSLFNTTGDTNDVKKLKDEIVSYMKKIAQYGAGLGIFLLCSLQRPDAKNLDPFIKSQSTCNISFRQNNSKSSEIATGDTTIAVGLEQREFVYNTILNNYGVVPLVNNKKIYELIKPYLQPGHRTIFEDEKKLNNIKSGGKEKVDVPKTEIPVFDKVTPQVIKSEPYEPYKGLAIIEEPRTPIKTEKPKKGGRERI